MIVRDKVIVVSGIGPGLGAKLAIHAAIEGARGVVITGRTQAKLDETEQKIREIRGDCAILSLIADICESGDCERVARETVARFGRADALINNAYSHPDMDHVETSDLDRWRLPFETNVIGTLRMTQAFLLPMKDQGGGSIVMINTKGTRVVPMIAEASYCASKAALANATRTLATEVGKYQIRVNGIHMGFMWGATVEPYFTEKFGSAEEGYKFLAAKHPMNRVTTDDECARAALFLASDYSMAMTGTAIDCNGGIFMG